MQTLAEAKNFVKFSLNPLAEMLLADDMRFEKAAYLRKFLLGFYIIKNRKGRIVTIEVENMRQDAYINLYHVMLYLENATLCNTDLDKLSKFAHSWVCCIRDNGLYK